MLNSLNPNAASTEAHTTVTEWTLAEMRFLENLVLLHLMPPHEDRFVFATTDNDHPEKERMTVDIKQLLDKIGSSYLQIFVQIRKEDRPSAHHSESL